MIPEKYHELNSLGVLLYDLFADTLISMREQQLGRVKIADNTIRLMVDKDLDSQRWATCFMTMRVPHGDDMIKFLDTIMPKFSLVSIQDQFCLLRFDHCQSSTGTGAGTSFKTISLY